MTTLIRVTENDDPFFVELVNAILASVLEKAKPANLWTIQIDNWFDHKWLGFSGKDLVAVFQEKLTFPPFVPNRVLGQWSFSRAGDRYVESALMYLPHPTENQPSQSNLTRRIEEFDSSGVFVWYSSNTVANGRGSLMVYTVANGKVDAWFAAFVRNEQWQLQSTKGVSRERLQQMIEAGLRR